MSDKENDATGESQEDVAAKSGWVPQEEWVESGRDADDWVDARQFNYRGQLMGRITQQGRELGNLQRLNKENLRQMSDMQKIVEELKDQNRKVMKARLKEERKKLMEVKVAATAEGDAETLVNVDEDLRELDKTSEALDTASKEGSEGRESPDPQPALTPEQQQEYAEWQKRNPWYGTDEKMTAYANFLGASSDQSLGIEAWLENVENGVNAVFNTQAKSPPKRQVVDEPGPNGRKAPRNKLGRSLTQTEREIGQGFVDDPDMPEIKSLKDYENSLAALEGVSAIEI